MSELIERSAAIEAICELHVFGKNAVFGEYNENSYAEHLHDAVKAVEEVEAVDAVPVVRCKNCTHYNAGFECLIDGYGVERDPEWFCGDGERKDGEQHD